jgi:hypothetical protein
LAVEVIEGKPPRRRRRHPAARSRAVAAGVSGVGFLAIVANLAASTPRSAASANNDASETTLVAVEDTEPTPSSISVVVETVHRVTELDEYGDESPSTTGPSTTGPSKTRPTVASTIAPKPPACSGSTC